MNTNITTLKNLKHQKYLLFTYLYIYKSSFSIINDE